MSYLQGNQYDEFLVRTPQLTGIADAIRSKTGGTAQIAVTDMASQIGSIQTKQDLSFVTAGAGQILSGYVGADKDGNPVNGTMDLGGYRVSVLDVTVPARTTLTFNSPTGENINFVVFDGIVENIISDAEGNIFSAEVIGCVGKVGYSNYIHLRSNKAVEYGYLNLETSTTIKIVSNVPKPHIGKLIFFYA